MSEALRDLLDEVLALKALPRAGWLRVGVEGAESVAAHSWGVAWLVLALCPPELDRGRALAIATLHDLAEVRVGDLTPHDAVDADEKARLEDAATEGLLAALPAARAEELQALYEEYARGTTPEGRFVKACDKLDMALQAHRYAADQGVETDEFVQSALSRLDGALKSLARAPARGAEEREP